jgi:hypothetical protein
MSDAPSSEPLRPNPHARRWRAAALAILVLGLVAAGGDYWRVSRSQLDRDDPSLLAFNKKEHRQMGEFFGQSGYLMDNLMRELENPGVQSALILVFSGMLAWGCWIFSRLPEAPNSDDFFKPSEKKPTG